MPRSWPGVLLHVLLHPPSTQNFVITTGTAQHLLGGEGVEAPASRHPSPLALVLLLAEGVVAAVKEVGLQVPLVVRLEGTNVEEGKAIINNSGLDVIAADDLKDGAQKIVKAVKG